MKGDDTMNEKQVIRSVLKHQGISQPELSERMGYARTTVGTVLADKHELKFEKIFRMLEAAGCEIVVRVKGSEDKTEWVFADNDTPIETERYVSEEELSKLAAIRAEMKPPQVNKKG